MRIKNLPTKKQNELAYVYKTCKSAKEQRRIQVILLLTKGYSRSQVSDIVRLSEKQIGKLVTLYNKKGIDGLRLKPHPKNNSRLEAKQKKEIKEIIESFDYPSQAGVKIAEDADYWSLTSLKLLIKQRYGVEYKSRETYRKLAHWCGMSWQRVEFEDERRSSKEVDNFKKRARIKLKKGTLSMWW